MKFWIKEARQFAGLAQKDLAKKLGIAPTTLSGYESGAHDPKSELLTKIADICGVSVDYLLGRGELLAQYKASNIRIPQHLMEESQYNIESGLYPGIFNPEGIIIAKEYQTLDEYGQKLVKTVIKDQLERMDSEREKLLENKTDRL